MWEWISCNILFYYIQAMADAAHPACILETRKTAPGLRLVDKWAVRYLSLFFFFATLTLVAYFLFLLLQL